MYTFSRRSFLKTGLTGLAAVALGNRSLYAALNNNIPNIGLQMYTVRDAAEKDFRGTLEKVSRLGFKGVESAFLPEGISIREAGKYYRDFGINVFAAHVELPLDEARKEEMLEVAASYDCKRMIWHGWPEDQRYKTEKGIRQLVEIYEQSNEFARANGLTFGIHNHWWEYEPQASGRYPYEIMLEELDKEIFFEIDTYWVRVAGHDPAELIRKFGSRAPLIHIKDGPAKYSDQLDEDIPDPMVALGTGSMDIPAIASAGRNSLEWIIVELDVVRGDLFRAISDSYDYLVSNQFAQGR